MKHAQGSALLVVILTAVVFSIAAFTVLMIALSAHRRPGLKTEAEFRARYAAEAGLVYAMQNLWNEAVTPYPPGCPVGAPLGSETISLDTDNNIATGPPLPPPPGRETDVIITVTNCGPNQPHTLSAKVTIP